MEEAISTAAIKKISFANALLTIVTFIAATISMQSDDPVIKQALDIPTFILSWAFIITTPIASSFGLYQYGKHSNRGDLPVTFLFINAIPFILWIILLLFTTFLPMGMELF